MFLNTSFQTIGSAGRTRRGCWVVPQWISWFHSRETGRMCRAEPTVNGSPDSSSSRGGAFSALTRTEGAGILSVSFAMVQNSRPKESNKMLSRRSLLGGLLTTSVASPFAAAIVSSEAEARPSIRPNRAPPPPRVERRPGPRPGYVWGPGYWAWRPRRRNYVWRRGHWERDRPGFRYQSPRWVLHSGNWVFMPGGWVR